MVLGVCMAMEVQQHIFRGLRVGETKEKANNGTTLIPTAQWDEPGTTAGQLAKHCEIFWPDQSAARRTCVSIRLTEYLFGRSGNGASPAMATSAEGQETQWPRKGPLLFPTILLCGRLSGHLPPTPRISDLPREKRPFMQRIHLNGDSVAARHVLPSSE
ncbi:hypothetical protein CEXT_323101 [Caerostris extrusa]|uniref:Uncharacterized protein n=1 Tax=Caerostris extrusa TaxID=172846 RepID=A0AAV4N2F4_CAEEX|nr:hypothetical protein CEXT_323101 [Caerostris extrusa]